MCPSVNGFKFLSKLLFIVSQCRIVNDFKILHCYLNLTLQVGYAPRNKTLVQVP